ncbi:MAG: hypothetical protein ACFFA0_07335 [Promethearchaeota archaeon]
MAETTFKIVAVLAVLTACTSLGWLVFDQFFIQDMSGSSSHQYYDDDLAGTVVPDSTWSDNLQLLVEFSVNNGETVYMSYVAYISIPSISPDPSFTDFRFKLDGIRLENPRMVVGRSTSGGIAMDIPVVLQLYNSTIGAGQHNLTVTFQCQNVNNNIVNQQTLFVEVFN